MGNSLYLFGFFLVIVDHSQGFAFTIQTHIHTLMEQFRVQCLYYDNDTISVKFSFLMPPQ